MAKILKPPYFEAVVNVGEKRLLDFLEVNLPENYFLIPNIEIASTNPRNNRTQYWEYDLIVVAPHAIFNIENKDWKGRIEGDDNYWYLNDRQIQNPLKTGRQKTAILASKLKEEDSSWGKAWIQNMVSLSYQNSYQPIISREAQKLTFELNSKLIDFITDSYNSGQLKDNILSIQQDIVNYLIGQQSKKLPNEKREIEGYEIIEVLEQEPNFAEYLVKPKGVNSTVRRRVKEYSLQISGLSKEELQKREERIKNQYNALSKIKAKPFILNVEFRIDEVNHLFYEITDFLEENSLRSEARHKTFTFPEKITIIRNIMVALKEAHKENIYHRDINPDNIYLSSGYAYLGNFGKSYFVDHSDEGYTVMPTINANNATAYHPLELTVGDANQASDIYSLGVLIYWLFTDVEPIKTPYELDKLGGKLAKDKLPSKLNSNLPKWLDEVCYQTIQTDDTSRIESIDALEEFILKSLESSSTEHPKPLPVISVPTSNNYEELKEGDTVGSFTIYETLGKGGYSKVFKVKHRIQDAYYTLKLFNESVTFSSVKDEYEALKDLNHNNIVKFVWNDESPTGQFYTVMEYLEGENLSNYTRTDARLPIHSVYQVGKDILSALIAMQSKEKPLMHRDIKPHNIIWDNSTRFVLIDFNVASSSTENKDFVGTNPYLAPDLITDNYKVNWDLSADTFALGVTLYELICKQYPWHPSKMPFTSKTPNNPKDIEPRISYELAKFLLKAIDTNREERFGSAQEMYEALLSLEDRLLDIAPSHEDEISVRNKLYHTQLIIHQGSSFNLKLYDKMNTYVDLHEAVENTLLRFKGKLENYKTTIDLGNPIKILLKVDDETIISDIFWKGGAKSFTTGNIDRVYDSMKLLFDNNKDKIKAFKISIEGANIVDYLNSLYSQSRYGNAGTRVNFNSSEFDDLTYTPTKLDKSLIPAIVDGQYKLLIITGNAGDGKTAFIKKIENDPNVKEVIQHSHRNGAKFKINGITFESNYDGSQDEENNINNEVLDTFFSPFEGLTNYNQAKEGRIIAINEGRLVEFLTTSAKHSKLATIIENYFYEEGHAKLPDGVMIVNLNLRSVVAQNDEGGSLFRNQFKALTKKELWKQCDSCSLAKECFIKYNVESFNDSAAGETITSRMEWLIKTVSLKRELHVTMRDMRSLIAYTLTRDYSCEDLKLLAQSTNSDPEKYWQYYYFNITNPSAEDSANQDRLINLLRETDIGEVAIPHLDRDLFFGKHLPKNYLEFAEREFSLLEVFNANKLYIPAHEQTSDVINKIKDKHKSFVRHQYFEGKAELIETNFRDAKSSELLKMPSYLLRLPYHSVFTFVNILNSSNNEESIKRSISRAVSLNEGCNNENLDINSLVLSSSDVKDPIGQSFKLFKLSDFELFVNKTEHLVKYLEYEPDSLIFRHKDEKHIRLTISLDLYEMLYFIQQGFSPSLNDLKGKFIELIVFKNLLENLSYNEIVVTRDNITFYTIKKDSSNHINVEPVIF
ncbi:serine/threonine protein kinase [Flavobacterium nitrogenifigens]|uniref:Serine/threonine protein kinase n=2 Tax=Flavobacterium TaxID=237 RepID=A0A7W7J1A5_9FLAO|nr:MULTISPECIES: protein kinase [Flavobacterium]MBB4804367.1 serine/threonine protein kinase [Flavobacterium nitrogenifigens]MBB6389237.1 serine/threonine protein kinase [Flavobacterium notoginsengisoli]